MDGGRPGGRRRPPSRGAGAGAGLGRARRRAGDQVRGNAATDLRDELPLAEARQREALAFDEAADDQWPVATTASCCSPR